MNVASLRGVNRFLLLFYAVVAPALAGKEPAIPFRWQESLLWVKVVVPQSERPLNFLLDTGAGASVIDAGVARRLGFKAGASVCVNAVGVPVAGQWYQVPGAKIGMQKLPEHLVGLDLQKLSAGCATPVDGLIGMDLFRGRLTQIDYANHEIRVLRNGVKPAGFKRLRLQIRHRAMRVPIRINGQKEEWVRLDTGCATALQWVSAEAKESRGQKIAVGFAGRSIPQTETCVRFGGYTFESVATGLHDSQIFPGEAGLLGNDLLARFSSIVIDARGEWLFLGPLR